MLKGASEPIGLGHVKKVVEDGVINGDVDIAVFDGYSGGTGAEKFYGDFPHSQHELDSFIGDDSSFIKLIGLFIYQVAVFLDVRLYFSEYF